MDRDIKTHLKKNWKNYIIGISLMLLIILVLTLFASVFVSQSTMDFSAASAERADAMFFPQQGLAQGEDERLITRSASMNIEVNNYLYAIDRVDELVEEFSIIVLTENKNRFNSNYRQIRYNVRIDSSNLDIFLDELQKLGKVENFRLQSDDITQISINLEQRLQRYVSQKQRHEQLLLRENISIDEEIRLHDRIDSLEITIAQIQSQLDRQEERVSYSRVDFTIREKKSLLDELGFLNFKEGFKLFLSSFEFGIRFVIAVVGFMIPIAFVYIIYRFIRKVMFKH